MRDFPIFTTETGVSSLILREIPYRKTAYIHVRDTQPGGLEAHLRECAAFCRMAGAEQVFAAGPEELRAYPLHTAVLEMQGIAWADPAKCADRTLVTAGNVGAWRRIYTERMTGVDHAAALEERQEGRIVSSGGAWFIHRQEQLLGIGYLADDRLLALAATQPGAGETVMHTLMALKEGQTLTLEVASTNDRALRLYQRLGFAVTAELTRWYRVGEEPL